MKCNGKTWGWNSGVMDAIQRTSEAYKAVIKNRTEETKNEYRR